MRFPSWSLRVARLIARVLMVIGFVFVVAVATPLDQWWVRVLRGRGYAEKGDVLVVLGGSEFTDGTLGWSSYLRSEYAVRTFKEGGFRTVVVAGGPASLPVAVPMSQWMRCFGIPADDIHLETASRSTRENALNTRDLLNSLNGRKVLLTSDYHLFRARRVFTKVGVKVLPLPIPDALKRTSSLISRWPVFCELGLETAKIGYYWLRGWI